MILVVDANILFSAFLKEGATRRLIVYGLIEIYTPKFVIEEFFEHVNELSEKTKINKEILKIKIKEFLSSSNIRFYSGKDIEDFVIEARQISPDKDDAMYFAAALKLGCPIWSNDKKLKEQNEIEVYSTEEIIDKLKSQIE